MPARPALLRLPARALLAALVAGTGCASDEPAWAVHHASFIPDATGLSGTQTWEFFTEDWASTGDPDAFACARAQLVTGAVVAALPGCEGCVAAYALDVTELESTCEDALTTDADYVTPRALGIGDVPADLEDLDPYPGRSLGWYLSTDGVELTFYGFAYEEGLDWDGQIGAPGWRTDQTYTLWPAYAWDLRD
jgi:hypothetical protein